MTESRSSTPRILAMMAAVIAVGFHIYLLKTHYELNYGEATGKLLCDISSTFSCSAASASRFAEFLGVPMALWGLLANLGYLLLAVWEPPSSPESRSGPRTALLSIAVILLGASVIMGLISIIALSSICPFCLATYVLSVVTAIGALKSYAPGLQFKIQLAPVLLGGFLLVGGFIANDILRSSYAGPSGDAMARAALSEWKANPALEIAATDPLAFGPERADAKLTLIEFADFRCIHCKMAVPPMKAFLASHPDTRLEFYAWPLDGECNTSIQQNNGASCLLARIVWCARSKASKGWEAHSHVFDRFEEWRTSDAVRSAIPSIATHLAVDIATLQQCADSDEAKTAVSKQAQLGSSLNLRGTPTVFANGKLLPAGTQIPVLNEVHRSVR